MEIIFWKKNPIIFSLLPSGISHNGWRVSEVAWVAGVLLIVIGGGAIWVEA